VDEQYEFIFYSRRIYNEKASSIVVDVYMWCDNVHRLESLMV